MARTTGPIAPEKRGHSWPLGILLGFLLVLGLYYFAESFLGGYSATVDPRVGPGAGSGTDVGSGMGKDLPVDGRQAVGHGGPGSGRRPVENPGEQAAPGFRLRCLDAQTGQRLEGLRAFDLEGKRDLGASDHEGLLVLGAIQPQRILLYGEGFLYRMLVDPSAPRLEPGQKVREIEVFRDRYTLSLLVRTQFQDEPANGTRIYLNLRRSDGKPMDGASFPTAFLGQHRRLSPRLRKAWLTHRILATMDPEMVLAMRSAPAWVIGEPLRPLLLPPEGGGLRFAEPGPYVIRAWSSDGQVAQADVSIQARQKGKVDLHFRPGKELQLLIKDPAGRALAGARVYLSLTQDGEETELREGISKENGELGFSGLFGDEKIRIRVEASGYEILEKPLILGRDRQVLHLKALARMLWRIRISEKGSGEAIPGVRMILRMGKGGASTRKTDKDGKLEISMALGESIRLELEKKGFQNYAEMIGGEYASTLPTRFEMIPDTIERQVKLGLICLLDGRAGSAQGGFASLVVKDPGLAAPAVMDMRRYLSGHRPMRHLRAKVDEDGRFRLWTDRKGQAMLTLFSDSGKQVRDILLVPGKVLKPRF